MTCSGKSTLGKFYCKKNNISYIDTDDEIYKTYKKKPHQIIKFQGWTYFRDIEHLVLKK